MNIFKSSARIKSGGFTLIELMLSVSIIAFFSSIVLGYLGSAQVEARNTNRNQIVHEYTKALALIYDTDRVYPGDTTYVCLGNYPGGKCGNNDGTNEDTSPGGVNDKLDDYIDLPQVGGPLQYTPIAGGTFTWKGAAYRCTPLSNCNRYDILW